MSGDVFLDMWYVSFDERREELTRRVMLTPDKGNPDVCGLFVRSLEVDYWMRCTRLHEKKQTHVPSCCADLHNRYDKSRTWVNCSR